MKKRLLSLVLCLVMVFSLFPAFGMNVQAADANSDSQATNTISNFRVADGTLEAKYSKTSSNTSANIIDGANNSIQFIVKRQQYSSRADLLVLKNMGSDSAVLSFDYEQVNCYSSDGGNIYLLRPADTDVNDSNKITDTTETHFDIPLAAGERVRIHMWARGNDSDSSRAEIKLTNIKLESSGGGETGTYTYTPVQEGLKVGDALDLSKTYYVNVNEGVAGAEADWREVELRNGTYYQPAGDSWTIASGAGMYYMDSADATHRTFYEVQQHDGVAYEPHTGDLVGGSSSVLGNVNHDAGDWSKDNSTELYYRTNDGQYHQVWYDIYGDSQVFQSGTAHFDIWLYYKDGNGNKVFITDGAETQSKNPGSDEGYPSQYWTYQAIGQWYWSHASINFNLYSKSGSGDENPYLYYMKGGAEQRLGDSSSDTSAVVYSNTLWDKADRLGLTYFNYSGGTEKESYLDRDVLTTLTLHTRELSNDVVIEEDDGTDASMGTLVDTTNNFTGNLFIQKRLYRDNATGTYNIKLESWATGDMSASSSATPMDIVLVLDTSVSMSKGSMGDSFTITKEKLLSLADSNGRTPCAYESGQSLYVYYCREENGVIQYKKGQYGEWSRCPDNVTVYTYQGIGALRYAAADFIDTLSQQKDANGNPLYRVAIISYANSDVESDNFENTQIYNGSSKTKYSRSGLPASTYQNALKWTDETGTKQLLTSTNSGFTAQGKTYSNHGLEMAIGVLQNRTNAAGRGAAVIMFTDGLPGNDNSGQGSGSITDRYSVAEDSIAKAYTLKNTYGATVYCIGLLESDTDNLINGTAQTAYINRDYLNDVSSNYPKAQSLENPGAPNTSTVNYYQVQNSTSSVTLADMFQNVISTLPKTDVPVDADSILKDVINTNDFAYPDDWTGLVTAETVKALKINSNKEIEWSTAAGDTVAMPAANIHASGDTVYVDGFDYAADGNFSTPASGNTPAVTGKKLVVRIKGLMPKHGGDVYSNSSAGIINDEGMYLPVESPHDTISERSYVVDFNANMKFAESGKIADINDTYVSQITNRPGLTGMNGDFAKSEGAVSYQLKAKTIIDGANQFQNYTFADRDTALVFGQYYDASRAVSDKNTTVAVELPYIVWNSETKKFDPQTEQSAKAWQVVNMVPASSVYYDDNLVDNTATIGDGSGYSSAVQYEGTTTLELEQGQSYKTWTLTFTGTGIDLYCTTAGDTGYVTAKLDGDNATRVTVYNHAETTRYNVPTISYRDKGYGPHTLTVTYVASSNYQFDGVRVYGPVNDQTLYEGTTEKDAVYVNLRDALITATDTDKVNLDHLDTTPGDSEITTRVLFVDDAAKLTPQDRRVVDENGEYVYVDADGNVVPKDTEGATIKTEKVYETEFDAYKANSPKNEIYLQKNEAITFQFQPNVDPADYNIWVGLSAPNASSQTGTVTITGTDGSISVNSAVDMYYEIKNLPDKSVTITNTGDAMISITNLKLTTKVQTAGGDAGETGGDEQNVTPDALYAVSNQPETLRTMLFAPVTMKTVQMASNNGVDPDAVIEEPETPDDPEPTEEPDPDPTPTPDPTPAPTPDPIPSVRDLVRQIISSFVQSLFRSISRLFG